MPAGSAEPHRIKRLGAIRNRANATNFKNYDKFIERVFCGIGREDNPELEAVTEKGFNLTDHTLKSPKCYHGQEAYNLLKAAAEVFLVLQCGIKVATERRAQAEGRARSGNRPWHL